jgi:hypothetical protein
VHSILNFSSQKWHFPLFLHQLTLNVWFCSEQFYWPFCLSLSFCGIWE